MLNIIFGTRVTHIRPDTHEMDALIYCYSQFKNAEIIFFTFIMLILANTISNSLILSILYKQNNEQEISIRGPPIPGTHTIYVRVGENTVDV